MSGAVVVLGNFDGVHLGHRAVIRRAVEAGRESGRRVIAASFDPHPKSVIRPGAEPWLLSSPEMRRELLLNCGVDEVRFISFDAELSRKSPEDFVRDVLVGELEAAEVIVGENFRFGHKAAGSFEDLARTMAEIGGEAHAVEIQALNGANEMISSSRIRSMLSEGEAEGAARLLGRPYAVRGEVVEGDRRGATIGFPTANLAPDPRVLIPARGVYAGHADVLRDGKRQRYAACTNVGVAPTFDRQENRIEAYLLDFEGDLYGETVEVAFTHRLRAEKKFSGVEELKAQISADVQRARLTEA